VIKFAPIIMNPQEGLAALRPGEPCLRAQQARVVLASELGFEVSRGGMSLSSGPFRLCGYNGRVGGGVQAGSVRIAYPT